MGKNLKNSLTFEALMIILALFLFCVITRVWPLVFLVIPGILIAALRLLFLSAKKPSDKPETVVAPPAPARPDTEQDVVRIAFGILERRITGFVTFRYPNARWIWETPNAVECFADGLPLTIMLSQAGGFRKAVIHVQNLQFQGLIYETVKPDIPKEPPVEPDNEDSSPPDGTDGEKDPVDYSIIAFEWVDANFLRLNSLCNEAIAAGESTLLIPAYALPVRAGWENICFELARSGFVKSAISDEGILISLPK